MFCIRSFAFLLGLLYNVVFASTGDHLTARHYYETGQHFQYVSGDISTAVEHYLSAWRLVGETRKVEEFDFPGMLNDLGILLVKTGDLQGAIEALKQAISISPKFTSAINNLAGILIEMGRSYEALSLYQQAVAYDQRNAELLHNTGYCFYTLNEEDRAIELWGRALEIKPDMYQTRGDVATALCSKGWISESQLAYNEAMVSITKSCNINEKCFSYYWVLLFQKLFGTIPVIQKRTVEENLKVRQGFITSALNVSNIFPADSISDPLLTIGCSSLGYYLLYQV